MMTQQTALMIVESPTKAKKIKTFVPNNIEVLASVGHIRDLPQNALGVNLTKHFEPTYEIPKRKQAVVEALRKAAKGASIIYLASDPDREGESIAWHLYEVLKDLPGKRTFYRIRYNEITPSAVLQALANPTQINLALVQAQQARRVIDRLSGYRLSKLIAKAIPGAKSAGRVQSAALRLIVDREAAIQAFRPTPYFVISARLAKEITFEAQLCAIDGKTVKFTIEGRELHGLVNQKDVESYLADLQGHNAIVTRIERKTLLKRPQPPFTTSTLQQVAATQLGYSPDQTMQLAQRLYEEGLITYMRTEGVVVSPESRDAAMAEIKACFGQHYLPQTLNVYAGKATAKQADAQQPHPPIQPTDVKRHALASDADPRQAKLYRLIWRRFMASQMAPAQIERTTTFFAPVGAPQLQHRYTFSATSSRPLFQGHLAVWEKEAAATEEPEAQRLPAFHEGEIVTCHAWHYTLKETQAPAHFNEASLVRELEVRGIGRPSTYASTIRTLLDRKYVTRQKGHGLIPTEIGLAATHYLLKEIADFVNVEFTRQMEVSLDRIAAGELAWDDMVATFYAQLLQWIKADTHRLRLVLALLSEVTQWRAPSYNEKGRLTWSDADFYHEMNAIFHAEADGQPPITKAQLGTLIRMASTYFKALPEVLTEATPTTDSDTLDQYFTEAQSRSLNEKDRTFVDSLWQQYQSRGFLTPKQCAILKRLAQSDSAHQTVEDPRIAQTLLAAFDAVTAWHPPTQRGKRTYDDHDFIESLKRQFASKGSLTLRQVEALKKLAHGYQDQLKDYGTLAAAFNIKAPRTAKNNPAPPSKTRHPSQLGGLF
ncbi:MAG: type I DNA topoisomerase [Kiritimatiellae bacterium]|nr:type I DNA topoisomerase [Kiritimatiellia bacterium]